MPTPTPYDFIEAVDLLHRAGLKTLIKIHPGLKKPIIVHGHKLKTSSADVAKTWFHGKALPDIPNLGVAAGDNSLVVIDIDATPPSHLNPQVVLEAILPSTPAPCSSTPRGGVHIYFTAPDGLPSDASNLIRRAVEASLTKAGVSFGRIDVKAGEAYAVEFPSITADGSYRWVIAPWVVSPPPIPTAWLDAPHGGAPNTLENFPPSDTQARAIAQDTLNHLPAYAREVWVKGKLSATRDRSGESYSLAALCVEHGITDPAKIASVVYTSLPHRQKFGPRKGGWDAWTDALSCARRALENSNHTRTSLHSVASSACSTPQRIAPPFALTPLVDVAPEETTFLINPYLPRSELTLFEGDPGQGKALALDTLIPTPHGFKRMGDIEVGDVVYDGNGRETTVMRLSPIFHNHKCYKVSFDDGTSVIADADHLWSVQTAHQRTNVGRWQHAAKRPSPNRQPGCSVVTTEEAAKNIKAERGKRHNYRIGVRPFAGRLRDLPVPPYTLGVWLGDGTSREAELTTADEEILEHVRNDGVSVGRPYHRGSLGKAKTYRLGGATGGRISRLRTPDGRFAGAADNSTLASKLRRLNLLNNKHIPQEYLFSSFEQRLALLQGLMDTDGCISKTGTCAFTTVNERLASGVSVLLAGLGIKNTTTVKSRSGGGTAYRMHFTTDLPVFRLRRKKERIPEKARPSTKRRYITSIEEVESVPVRCITVSSPEHTYLCTNQFVITHNSWAWMALAAGLTGSKTCPVPYDHTAPRDAKIVVLTTEDSLGKTVRSRLELLDANLSNIYVFTPSTGAGGDQPTACDLPAVAPLVASVKPDLVVVDPITLYATTDASFDGDKAVAVRRLLRQLIFMARQDNFALLACRHYRKEGGRAIYRGLGSIDYAATARSILSFGISKDALPGVRAVAHTKSNLAPEGPALEYRLFPSAIPPFKWLGVRADIRPDDLTIPGGSSGTSDEACLLSAACEFLTDALSNGPAPAKDIIKEAHQLKISERTLYRAKESLGVRSKRQGFGAGSQSLWFLAENP